MKPDTLTFSTEKQQSFNGRTGRWRSSSVAWSLSNRAESVAARVLFLPSGAPTRQSCVLFSRVSVGAVGKRLASVIKCLLALSLCLQLAFICRISRKLSSV